MTNKELIELLRTEPLNRRELVSFYYDLLEKIDGLKTNYTEYMTTAPVCCDEELKRIPIADYDLCCALLTMLLREDYFMQDGKFEERYENGDVRRIIDRMLELLDSRE